jgi:hypothetical protein
MKRQMSGCDPSRSVDPYSDASLPELTDFSFHLDRFVSSASAATARPTYRCYSDNAKSAGSLEFSTAVDGAVAPGRFGFAEVVEHHLRPPPSRRDGDRGYSLRFALVSLRERQSVHGEP